MAKGYRQGRIGEEIRKIISDLLLSGLKDPALDSMISITAVEVSGDNSYATVYFSKLNLTGSEEEQEEKKKELTEAFRRASGFIRKTVGENMKLRHVPELRFRYDTSEEYGRHIEELLSSIDIQK
ncbi:MAG: 30S ribosome-binding factor RbfA [Clostridiales bacterium]|nr:30S ribosome-binding factor RbfA [Clostridiales bacterium]MDD7035455.1 30S ribosome-binding factor RbfA [Bacillota bacterium]MDY2919962.1 30S ribosome-binding factor RbfA [Lentihominibacter sp.]